MARPYNLACKSRRAPSCKTAYGPEIWCGLPQNYVAFEGWNLDKIRRLRSEVNLSFAQQQMLCCLSLPILGFRSFHRPFMPKKQETQRAWDAFTIRKGQYLWSTKA